MGIKIERIEIRSDDIERISRLEGYRSASAYEREIIFKHLKQLGTRVNRRIFIIVAVLAALLPFGTTSAMGFAAQYGFLDPLSVIMYAVVSLNVLLLGKIMLHHYRMSVTQSKRLRQIREGAFSLLDIKKTGEREEFSVRGGARVAIMNFITKAGDQFVWSFPEKVPDSDDDHCVILKFGEGKVIEFYNLDSL